ncbi:hypothetical protein OG928_16320 [Embleya sp. NBC_00896]|nr:hypothetical protein OG928_16230 [Embleya sp. NBC_00896]WSY13176.1 hypothetical protein OG928_16275 [Embleya sp. NBC_00896]WSY13185.1 hypothetical protein OG928_16320 [Embleya sp. NBC_00896]
MIDKTGRLLTVPQAAERRKVGERFVRRLIAERCITFVDTNPRADKIVR